MKKDIKAIETEYKGYRFRSRLEARWAYFFDLLGWEWDYELDGYHLPSGEYLPDFYIKTINVWAEVKAVPLDKTELALAYELAAATNKEVFLLVGVPQNITYRTATPEGGGYDYVLTNHHDYPQTEQRTYACPSEYERFRDTEIAAWAARGARFEHGEKPVLFSIPLSCRSEMVTPELV
jgi:hypothetical protein